MRRKERGSWGGGGDVGCNARLETDCNMALGREVSGRIRVPSVRNDLTETRDGTKNARAESSGPL